MGNVVLGTRGMTRVLVFDFQRKPLQENCSETISLDCQMLQYVILHNIIKNRWRCRCCTTNAQGCTWARMASRCLENISRGVREQRGLDCRRIGQKQSGKGGNHIFSKLFFIIFIFEPKPPPATYFWFSRKTWDANLGRFNRDGRVAGESAHNNRKTHSHDYLPFSTVDRLYFAYSASGGL